MSEVKGCTIIYAPKGQAGEPAVDRAGARCVRDLDCKIAFRFAQAEGFV